MAAEMLSVHAVGGYDTVTVDRDGKARVSRYWRDGVLHRTNGPAVESSSGAASWFLHGVLHRDGGPAVITAAGDRHWFTLGVERHADTLQPGLRSLANQPHTYLT